MSEWVPFGLLLQIGGKLVDAGAAHVFSGFDEKPDDIMHLVYISGSPGQRQIDYARVLRVDVTTFGRTVDRLEADGYLVRDADPHDRRAVRLRLTDRGEELAGAAKKLILEREAVVADAFGKSEFAALRGQVARLIDLMRTLREEAEGQHS